MIIRTEQQQALAKTAEDGYVQSAVEHLEKHDPLLASAAGRAGLEQVARDGLEAARSYGLGNGRPLQLYLEIMMALGSGFDTDPQFAWLHDYLQPMEGLSTLDRARLLHFHVTAYLHRAYGAKGQIGRAVLERASLLNLEQLRDTGLRFESRGMDLLKWLHPERMDFLEPEAVDELRSSAWSQATDARLGMPEGGMVLFLLMFAFGHQVCSDPLHPWLKPLLEDDGADEGTRAARLWTRTRAYLTVMLRQLTEATA
jgi:hypothetical protein